MTRFLLLLALAAPAVGCMNVRSVGPLAKWTDSKADAKDAKDEPLTDAKDTTAAAMPGGRPVPPAILITPGEVAPENAEAALTKLGNEIEYDLKNTPPAPKTPIISRYKNGAKIQ